MDPTLPSNFERSGGQQSRFGQRQKNLKRSVFGGVRYFSGVGGVRLNDRFFFGHRRRLDGEEAASLREAECLRGYAFARQELKKEEIIMRIGLSVFGSTYLMGLHPRSTRLKVTSRELLDRAAEAGVYGVEMPVALLEGEDLSSFAQAAGDRKMFINLATSGYDPKKLSQALKVAEKVGALTVRTVVGGAALGGDRRPMAGRWQSFLDDVLRGLKEAAAAAEAAGVNLALENHQDLASEELLHLCETIDSPRFGITLDTGNPLATAEDPLVFARRTAPFIKNVHLKDYRIYPSQEGYRLSRCPLGQGVIEFPALFSILDAIGRELPMPIEVGAPETRHVRVLADDYWHEYPPRTAAQLAEVFRLVQSNARPSEEDWRTPHELGAPAEAVAEYERRQLEDSFSYILPLFKKFRPATQ
jgi:sugar phosphate isomerase/epimerase